MDPITTALATQILNVRFGDLTKGTETRLVGQQGGDETFTVLANADGTYSVKSPSGQWLSIQADGRLGARDGNGEPGPWEKFTREGNVLIELPKEGVTRERVMLAGSAL